jgi:hypothetical protein
MGDDERALPPRVRVKEILEVLVAKVLHRIGEVLFQEPG